MEASNRTSLHELAEDVDLLLAEATLAEPASGEHRHRSGTDAGVVAAKAALGGLVPTHFAAAAESILEHLRSSATQTYEGPIDLAAPVRAVRHRLSTDGGARLPGPAPPSGG